MAYRDILVFADTDEGAAARLDQAAELAKQESAHIVALHVSPRPYVPADIMGTGVSAELLAFQIEQGRKRAADARKIVEAASQRNGIAMEWRETMGDLDDLVTDHGLYCDLIILGHGTNPLDPSQPLTPSPGDIVIAARRPILMLPPSYKTRSSFDRILIAWKATAEASRAVHDALPLLKRAKTISIVAIHPDKPKEGHAHGADIAKHLAHHGVQTNVAPIAAADSEAGKLLIEQARAMSADLVVMGAYGHSRLRELALGGATRDMLKQAACAVLLSH